MRATVQRGLPATTALTTPKRANHPARIRAVKGETAHCHAYTGTFEELVSGERIIVQTESPEDRWTAR